MTESLGLRALTGERNGVDRYIYATYTAGTPDDPTREQADISDP